MAKKKETAPSPQCTESAQPTAEPIRCKYVRFRDPVPTRVNNEPVYEFYIESRTNKYAVDSILYYVADGVIEFRAHGETGHVPDSNVVFAREA